MYIAPPPAVVFAGHFRGLKFALEVLGSWAGSRRSESLATPAVARTSLAARAHASSSVVLRKKKIIEGSLSVCAGSNQTTNDLTFWRVCCGFNLVLSFDASEVP